MRAVIIEKDEKILQQIQSILQNVDSGYELVGTAVNGQSGYELISALRPNLVIMDIELPRMNGMSMLKKLRAEAFDFKVVVLSGTENFQYAKQAIELSVDGYIMKPIRPLELKRALMQICEKMRNEYWLNASFTVENLLIGCMNGQYQPENKLNEIKGTLKEQRRIAEESEQRKNDIIVYLAHDLKTPLTSIIAYLSLLNESPDMSEEQRAKYIGISLEKAKRLGELINEFFEITRYNLQNITLDKKEFYLYVLLEQVMDSFAAVFKQKGLEWKIEVDDKILIYGDPDRLARVFENLLRNAVSYCYPNSLIEVYGMIDGDNAEILVRNQGKTIPEHQLNNLFEKFYRLDEARSSETGGAGLGLAIAKEIIELHDGTIKANSQNEYTTFIIRLPRKKEEQ